MSDKPRGQDKMNEVDIDNLERGPAGPGSMQVKSKEEGEEEVQKESDGGREASKITVAIDPEVAQKLRSLVYHTPGLTMYEVVEEGVQRVVRAVEEKHGEIPDFDRKLKGGKAPLPD